MLRFFLSIKTFLWLCGICIVICVVGSYAIPQHLDVFSEINDMPLFRWLELNTGELGASYWIYALIACLALLCLNLLVCTADVLVMRASWKKVIEVISPQVLHIGVLLVFLGHLVSASVGYKEDVPVREQDSVEVRGFRMTVDRIDFVKLRNEDSTRWRVSLRVDDEVFLLEPARPAFYKGVGFFAKSAEKKRMKVVVGLVRDPGTSWEIFGAALFVLGSLGIFVTLFRKKTT